MTRSYRVCAANNFGSTTWSNLATAQARLAIDAAWFTDANLKAAVASSGATYVDELTSLSCPGAGISDLAGLEKLVALTSLDLSGNAISDVSALTGLVSLVSLNLSGAGNFAIKPSDRTALAAALTGCAISWPPIYGLGGLGPAGGVIFYDKGSVSNGWQYLEASTTESPGIVWGGYSETDEDGVAGLGAVLGSGAANSLRIVQDFGAAEPYAGVSNYAARLCSLSTEGGFGDWFLPSIDEVKQMYARRLSIGAGSDSYLSSSQSTSYPGRSARTYYFGASDAEYDHGKHNDSAAMITRAARAFRDADPTYVLVYSPNGADSGAAPSDAYHYEACETATVLANTGSLAREGYTFAGWNTTADGSGTSYAAGATPTMVGDLALYARWAALPTGAIGLSVTLPGEGNVSIIEGQQLDVYRGDAVSVSANFSGTAVATGYAWSVGGLERPDFADQPSIVYTVPGGAASGQVIPITVVVAANEGPGDEASLSLRVVDLQLVGLDMKSVAGGSFNNGTAEVTLTSYSMSSTEITQAQYASVMGCNPSSFTNDTSYPVEMVTWFDAMEFCNKLSLLAGLEAVYTIGDRVPATGYPITAATVTMDIAKNGYRLPTEAEWEFAARGGNLTHGYTFAGSNDANVVAWSYGNSGSIIHTVGGKAANELGLYDMSGNVWEWCWDWFGGYASGAQTDPTGPSSGSVRDTRGGGWGNGASICSVSYRSGNNVPHYRSSDVGFRIVRRP